MSNLSILEQNIIHGFGAYDDAESVERTFLSLIESKGLLDAEKAANEWGAVSDFLNKINAVRNDSNGLMEFIQQRHLNMRGRNLKLKGA